jgi:outer membrane protein assembly factor BamB
MSTIEKGRSALIPLLAICLLIGLAACQKPRAPEPAASPSTSAQPDASTAPAEPAAQKAAEATPTTAPSRAVITFFAGEVAIERAGDSQPAEIGQALDRDAVVKVGAGSSCELQLGNMAVVRVDENTILSIANLSLEAGKARVVLGLDIGTVICKVNTLVAGERFQVRTLSAVFGVRGTEFVVSVRPDAQTLVAVRTGAVAVLPRWADFMGWRDKLPEDSPPIAPAIAKVEESARVVSGNQQLTIRAETARAWRKELAALEEKVSAIAASVQSGGEISQAGADELAAAVEKLAPSIAAPLARTTAIAAAPAKSLVTAAAMRLVALPAALLGAPQQPATVQTAAPQQPSITISVAVQPADADIYLNGSLAGKGACTGFFSIGEKLTFVAKREGYVEKTLSITVDKDTGGSFEIALERTPEKVSIRTTPEDAEILLDGTSVGTGSYTELVAPGETRAFTVRREGYADKSVVVDVTPGSGKTWQVALEEMREGISIRTDPPDADILLDGKPAGRGAFAQGFKVGQALAFTVRREGYADATLEVTVGKGEARDYEVKLEPKPLVRRFPLSQKPIVGEVVVAKGMVIAADSTGVLAAATERGEAGWRLPTKNATNENSFPVAIGNRLYFSGAAELVVADPVSGAALRRDSLDVASAHLFGQRIAVLDSTGLLPLDKGIRLLDLATGATLGTIVIDGGSKMTPSVWQGRVVTVNQAGMLYVIDPAGGKVVAEIPTKSIQPVAVAVQVVGNRGFFADRKGLAVCVDLEAAKVVWQTPLSVKSSVGVFQDLACGPEGVFAWVKGTLYGLSPHTGEPLWAPITGVSAPPLLREGRLYYGTDQGSLRIADAATGKPLGTLDVKAKISTRPAWSEGMLFVGTSTGEIVQINPAAVK